MIHRLCKYNKCYLYDIRKNYEQLLCMNFYEHFYSIKLVFFVPSLRCDASWWNRHHRRCTSLMDSPSLQSKMAAQNYTCYFLRYIRLGRQMFIVDRFLNRKTEAFQTEALLSFRTIFTTGCETIGCITNIRIRSQIRTTVTEDSSFPILVGS